MAILKPETKQQFMYTVNRNRVTVVKGKNSDRLGKGTSQKVKAIIGQSRTERSCQHAGNIRIFI